MQDVFCAQKVNMNEKKLTYLSNKLQQLHQPLSRQRACSALCRLNLKHSWPIEVCVCVCERERVCACVFKI